MAPEPLKKVPNGAAGLFLLGQVGELQLKHKEATRNYKQALKQDPTLWCAFERLCALAPDEIDPAKYFSKNHPFIQQLNSAILDRVHTTPEQPRYPFNQVGNSPQVLADNLTPKEARLPVKDRTDLPAKDYVQVMPPPVQRISPQNDSKENMMEVQCLPTKPLNGPLSFDSTNQLPPHGADDDCVDAESSIASELKTPTSSAHPTLVTPTNNIVSHTLKKT